MAVMSRLKQALDIVLKAVPELKKEKYKFQGKETLGPRR